MALITVSYEKWNAIEIPAAMQLKSVYLDKHFCYSRAHNKLIGQIGNNARKVHKSTFILHVCWHNSKSPTFSVTTLYFPGDFIYRQQICNDKATPVLKKTFAQ